MSDLIFCIIAASPSALASLCEAMNARKTSRETGQSSSPMSHSSRLMRCLVASLTASAGLPRPLMKASRSSAGRCNSLVKCLENYLETMATV